jgi:hypothetical protein
LMASDELGVCWDFLAAIGSGEFRILIFHCYLSFTLDQLEAG